MVWTIGLTLELNLTFSYYACCICCCWMDKNVSSVNNLEQAKKWERIFFLMGKKAHHYLLLTPVDTTLSGVDIIRGSS